MWHPNEESLVSSNSKLLWFHSVRPNVDSSWFIVGLYRSGPAEVRKFFKIWTFGSQSTVSLLSFCLVVYIKLWSRLHITFLFSWIINSYFCSRKTSKMSNLPPDATFIDHLHAMKRKDSGVSMAFCKVFNLILNCNFLWKKKKESELGIKFSNI